MLVKLIGAGLATLATALATGIAKAKAEPPVQWGGSVSARYQAAVDAPIDSFTVYSLGGAMRKQRISYTLNQSVTHNSVKEQQGRVEHVVADTNLGVTLDISHPEASFRENLSFSATLPVSLFSRENGIRTVLGAAWSLTYPRGPWSFGITPYLDYQVNEYKTSNSTGGAGGFPLVQAVLGANAQVIYNISDSLRFNIAGALSKVRYEDVETVDDSYLYDHPYAISGSLVFVPEFWAGGFLAAAIVNGNQLEQYGGIDFYIFDRYSSNWSVSVGYSF